jgi:hypothetical protein
MNVGPGVFSLSKDTSRYECGAVAFTKHSYDEVEALHIPILFRRAG